MKTEMQKENMIRPLRLGFLGIGWIGRNRMDALIKQGVAEVTAVSDLVIENAYKAAMENTIICSSFEEMLQTDSLDGIVIATPSALHAQQANAALYSGFPVFCQKPLGRNLDEVESVIDNALQKNKLLGIDLSYRFLKTVQIVEKLIRSGDIGKIFAVEAVFHNAYGPDKPWFYDPVLSGGGCVMDLGIHLIDLVLWLFDFPQIDNVYSHLYANGQRIQGRKKVEDYAVSHFDMENGCNVTISCSWKLQAGCDAIIGLTFYGTEGALSIKNSGGSFYNFFAQRYRKTTTELLYDLPDDWGGRAIVNWAQKLSEDSSFDHSVMQMKMVANVMDLIYAHS